MIGTTIATLARLGTGATVHWAGCRPEQRQRIYFANHSSHLDFLLLWASLPAGLRRRTRPVAASDYWQGGRLRRLAARLFNPVLIDRRAATRRPDPLETMLVALADGSSLILFPEGTRSLTGEIGRFHGGLYALAQRRPDVQLVPVYLANLDRVLPKGAWLPVPLPCSVAFGAPLSLLPGEPRCAFLERAREAVLDLAGAERYQVSGIRRSIRKPRWLPFHHRIVPSPPGT